MLAILKLLLTLFFVCWGLYVLAYGVGVATTHPATVLGRMIGTVSRGFLWGCVGVSKVLALVLSTLSDGLRKLLS